MNSRLFNRRGALAGGVAAAAGLGYFALRSPKGGGHARPEVGTFHRGNGAEPGSLDPAQTQSDSEDFITADLLTGLMANDPQARPIPGMALSWTTSPDGLVWTFKLRNALWSDGTSVTADDFIFAWRRMLDPTTAAPYAYFLYFIKNARPVSAGKLPGAKLGVRALNSHTLEITLEHPAPYLLQMLDHMSMYPLPRHVIATKGKNWAKPGNFVGNGPYTLSEWVPNDHITLIKNPNFYEAAKVAIKKVIYYPTDDYGAALQRMRAGELDTQDRIPTQEIDWIRAHMPETIDNFPQLTAEYVIVNHGRKPFDDIRVRTALNLAINREVITGKIIRTGDIPAYNVVPPGVANFPGGNFFDFRSQPYAKRIAKAQELMRQAGFGPDNRIGTSYMIRSTAPGGYRAVAAALQQMFALIYLDITILPNDFAIFMSTTDAHNFDICQPAWGADFNDAETFLNLFQTGGGDNWGQYSNPEFDSLLAASQHDMDLESRGQKLADAERMLIKDQAVMPLFFWNDHGMSQPYVKGWFANNTSQHRTRWVTIDEKARAALFAS